MAQSKINDLVFTIPTVGPRVYITRGPSGWTETFKRADLDKELERFVDPHRVPELVDAFLMARDVADTPTDWFTVVGFLARTTACAPANVPHTVAIAFWGHVVMAMTARGAN
jgi:hypothetical protein